MRTLLALALTLCLAGAASAAGTMQLTSPAFPAGGDIPRPFSAYGENHSPPLAWTAVPGAKTYALTLRDPDAPGGDFVHWLVWNIPGGATSLPQDGVAGAVQGTSGIGRVGYFGPRPPGGRHHYHFTIYALDAPLSLPAGADAAKLAAAMKGHVLASGELVGTFAP
jgi:Raf kinase inhibitor-like YbhB/YbcL family protein